MIVTLKSCGEEMAVNIEQANDTHVPFIMNSWLESYRVGDEPRKMGNEVFFRNHHRIATELVNRDGAICLVATPEHDPGLFIGWACAEPSRRVLHYAFVKKGFREAGLFRHFVAAFSEQGKWGDDGEIILTHHTYFIDKIRTHSPRWKRQLVYNPYLRSAAA